MTRSKSCSTKKVQGGVFIGTRLKEKQKGRNQDINVNEMGNYREIKKQLKQKEQKLEKANNQTKQIDNSSKDINTILDNLKPTLMNKNNMVISSEDVQKIIQKM